MPWLGRSVTVCGWELKVQEHWGFRSTAVHAKTTRDAIAGPKCSRRWRIRILLKEKSRLRVESWGCRSIEGAGALRCERTPPVMPLPGQSAAAYGQGFGVCCKKVTFLNVNWSVQAGLDINFGDFIWKNVYSIKIVQWSSLHRTILKSNLKTKVK